MKPQPSWGSSPYKLSKDEILLAQNKPRVISPTPHTTHVVRPQSPNSKTNSWGYPWGDAVGNSPGDMESLPAAVSVTGHACSRSCFALPALLFTDVAGLQKKKKKKIRKRKRKSAHSERQSVCFTLTVHQEAKPSRTHNCVQSSPSCDNSSGLFLSGMHKTHTSSFSP